MVHEEERLVLVSPSQPVERDFDNRIRRVSAVIAGKAPLVVRPFAQSRIAHDWVEVGPLAGQHTVIVERRLLLQMPLADHGRLVAGLFDQMRQRLVLGFHSTVQRRDAVDMAVLARDQRSPGGRADRVRTKGIRQPDPLFRQPVDVGRGIERSQAAAVSTDGVGRVIVRHDEQDVRPVGGNRGRAEQDSECDWHEGGGRVFHG